MVVILHYAAPHCPWNKGKLVGQKPPLNPRDVWAIQVRLQIADKTRNLALFNLSLDSKTRGCDLLSLKVSDVRTGADVRSRTKIIQKKAGSPVQFEIMDQSRDAMRDWCEFKELEQYTRLSPSRKHLSRHLSTRQFARLVDDWVQSIDLRPISLRASLDASHKSHADLSDDGDPVRGN